MEHLWIIITLMDNTSIIYMRSLQFYKFFYNIIHNIPLNLLAIPKTVNHSTYISQNFCYFGGWLAHLVSFFAFNTRVIVDASLKQPVSLIKML